MDLSRSDCNDTDWSFCGIRSSYYRFHSYRYSPTRCSFMGRRIIVSDLTLETLSSCCREIDPYILECIAFCDDGISIRRYRQLSPLLDTYLLCVRDTVGLYIVAQDRCCRWRNHSRGYDQTAIYS